MKTTNLQHQVWRKLLLSLILLSSITFMSSAQNLYTGVWEEGSGDAHLIAGKSWTSFVRKWTELGKKNYRLVDIETYLENGQRKYTGTWEKGSYGYYLYGGLDWTTFSKKWEELGKKNYRLVDIETYMHGQSRKYIGIWKYGRDSYYLWAGVDWNNFTKKWEELSKQNLRLVDIETYQEGRSRKYIGVWRSGSAGHYLWAGVDWNNFSTKWKELNRKGLRLADMETYVEGGVRKYTGVWKAGRGKYYLWSGVDFENFSSKRAELAQENYQLIDIETYSSSCQVSCLNKVLMPDNPETNNRDTYDYAVPGGRLHCTGAANSCGSGTQDVIYSWPNIKIDGKYYARLSSLYAAKDKIFTLPFQESPSSMRKNAWRYHSGVWHHAIDYNKTNWSSFLVRAAAPGRVIFIGWENWSGNTVVISHDVGSQKDVYRTIYMHLRNGAMNDCANAWNNTVPTMRGAARRHYENYLNKTGCPRSVAQRNPSPNHWGTDAQTIDPSLLGRRVNAGTVLGWAGDNAGGGCGCMPSNPDSASLPDSYGTNTHLHLFFTRRDPSDNKWYFFDPYGIYATPDCYPTAVDAKASGACVRYPVSWKGGKPSLPR